jgi:hypothetical protein
MVGKAGGYHQDRGRRRGGSGTKDTLFRCQVFYAHSASPALLLSGVSSRSIR